MNKHALAGLFIALVFLSGVGTFAPSAHAQTAPPAQPPAQQVSPTPKGEGTPQLNPQTTVDRSYGAVMQWIMGLFAWLLGVAIVTLDNAVYYTVITMGAFVNSLSANGHAIGITWRVLRDIGNIALIFGFLAVGISTILDLNIYGYSTKMLPMLLLAAVFLNFSLFISEAVIDAGNFFATELYTQINGGSLPAAPPSFSPGNLVGGNSSVHNEGISNKIMAQLGLPSIYGDVGRNPKSVLAAGAPWYIGFMGILLFMIAAFVFFSLAFILISRFVVLILLIVVAPIGFAGLAVPKLEKFASQWWGQLFEQTFTAPVLFLLLYIALRVITDANFLGGFGAGAGSAASWTGFLSSPGGQGLTGFAGLVLSFIVAMGLLLVVIIVAKRMSAAGAGAATKWGGRLSGLTLAAAAPGFAGRQTLGRASQIGARYLRGTSFGRIPILGSGVVGALDRGAKASYEVRSGKGPIKALGADIIDLGKPQTGGYRKIEEEGTKAREAYAKSLRQTQAEREEHKTEEGRKALMEQTVREIESQNKAEVQEMALKHAGDIKPYNDEVDTRRSELAVAERGGDNENIKAKQTALNNALRDQEREREKQRREREELSKVHEEMVKVQKEEVAARQREIERIERQPQLEYAASLTSKTLPFFGGWRFRNKKAAENIVKNAKKSKSEKESDKLFELLEKATKKEEQGGKEKAAKPADAH